MKKSFPATLSNLKKIRAKIKDFLKIYEVDLKIIKNIQLAVDEAVTNIIKHSYKEEKQTNYIEINLNVIENELEISLCDDGYAVDKKKIKPRNINEIKPGGLGTLFIDQIMDNVRWVKSDIWNNKLILKKKIK